MKIQIKILSLFTILIIFLSFCSCTATTTLTNIINHTSTVTTTIKETTTVQIINTPTNPNTIEAGILDINNKGFSTTIPPGYVFIITINVAPNEHPMINVNLLNNTQGYYLDANIQDANGKQIIKFVRFNTSRGAGLSSPGKYYLYLDNGFDINHEKDVKITYTLQ